MLTKPHADRGVEHAPTGNDDTPQVEVASHNSFKGAADADHVVETPVLDTDKQRSKARKGSVEMIRSPVVLHAFRMLIENPLVVVFAWQFAVGLSFAIGSRYQYLKKRPLNLPSFHNHLQHVQDSLMKDFSLGGSNSTFDSIVIWSPDAADLREDPDFERANVAVQDALKSVKESRDKLCAPKALQDMAWQSYDPHMPPFLRQRFLAADGSAATVLVSHPCVHSIRSALVNIDGKYGGLRVALGSPNAVALSSMDQASDKIMHHMIICAPIMWLLLWLNTGNCFRAATAFICLVASYVGTQAATVIIKYLWADLNYSMPDQSVMFIELALCLDYCLFFWTRFSQERRQQPEQEFYKQAVMTTLQTSGAVIAVSVAVLAIGYVAMCFYPDQNTVGCLAGNLQLIIGINLLGFYSLVIPASLAVQFPGLFDETKAAWMCLNWECEAINRRALAFREAYKRAFNSLSFFITRLPWMLVMPLAVYACFVPFILEIKEFKPNFNMFEAAASRTVPEYEAFQVMKAKFNLGHVEPVLALLHAENLGPSHPLLQHHDDVTMLQLAVQVLPSVLMRDTGREHSDTELQFSLSPQFRVMVCRYISKVLESTRGTEYEIGPSDVQSIWWNSTSGTCASHPMTQDFGNLGLVSADGHSQVLKLFPAVYGTSLGAQAMTRDFWDVVEPESRGTFVQSGQRYEFRAQHYTPLATMMLMQRKFAERAPLILTTLVVLICIVVGLLFSSVGVGVKMVITVIMPIVAEFGLIVGVYQHGWLEWAGIPRTGGLLWVHLYTGMGLLLGLAIDYDIFLFARVYERRQEGFDNISAVRLAITETASVITVAGTMMCVSFFFIAKSDIFFLSQVGVLYFFGVALDTYVVRTLLAPAILCLSEKMNYWPGYVPPAVKSWDGDISKLDS